MKKIHIISYIFILLVLSSFVSGISVLYYELEECSGSTLHDNSTTLRTTNGAIQGDPTWSSEYLPKYGDGTNHSVCSLILDGTGDFVNMGTDNSDSVFPAIPTDYTITTWVWFDTTGTVEYLLNIQGNNHVNLRFLVANTLLSEARTDAEYTTLTTLPENSWHHIALTHYGSTNFSLWIDGELNGTDYTMGIPASSNGKESYGSYQQGTDQDLNGMVGKLQMWNEALTATQLMDDYNCGDFTGCPLPSTAVVLELPLDNNYTEALSTDFIFNVVDYTGLTSCDLFVNISDSWGSEGRNTTILSNGSSNTITASLPNGNYLWNINCSNGTYDVWGATNYTIDVNVPFSLPIVTLYSPQNASTSNNLTYNLHYNASTEYALTNVSLYLDGIYNKSNTTAIINNFNSSFLLINFTEGSHNWSVKAFDNNTNETMSVNFTIIIDITEPVVNTNFVNDTFVFLENLTGQFNLTDNTLLHSLNVTLPDDGITIFNVTGISASNYTYNLKYNISELSPGNHILKVRVADAHTATELAGDYIERDGLFEDYISYEFYDKGTVTTQLKDSSIFDKWESKKMVDKYIQILKPATPKETQVFTEESDLPIYIINHPNKYKGQWVVIGNHWKDYVLKGEEQSTVSIKRINLYKVEVTVSNIKNNPKKLTFASVGDLNIIEEYYNFTVGDYGITYTSPVLELTEQSIILNISTIGGTEAKLTYNGSTKTTVKTTVGAYDIYTATFITPFVSGSDLTSNISFHWDANITFNSIIYANTFTYNQTVEKLGLDNCSTYTTKVLNITILRSDTEKEENATLEGYFKLWEGSKTNSYRAFNLTWSGESNYGVCSLRNGTFSIFAQLEFDNAEFDVTDYYLANATISNVTSYLDLYFVPNATTVTFSVNDQNDNEVQDVYISILKYDFPTNSYITTQVIKTNTYGEAVGNIILNTQWYKFLLLYDGEIKLETEPIKIGSTSRNFRINLLVDFFDLYNIVDGVTTSLTFTNSTRNFAYTFLNPSGTVITACLDIIERTTIADVDVNSSCISSAGGTILLNIGSTAEVVGRTFLATGSVNVNPWKITDILGASFEDGYRKYGKDGIFLSFLVRLTFALMGIWNPIVAIILLVVADIGMVAMGLYYLEWPTFMVYIILASITIWRLKNK